MAEESENGPDPVRIVVASEQSGPRRASDLGNLKPMLETIGLVAAPLSFIASLLVYFGIVRTRAEAEFFGLDPAIYGYSTQDHIVRSLAPMLGPMAVGSVAVVLAVFLNGWIGVTVRPGSGGSRERLVDYSARLGVGLLVVGAAWQWVLGSEHSYWAPVLLGVGGVVTAVALGVRAMAKHESNDDSAPTSPIGALPAGAKLALGFVVVFAVFGLVTRIAQSEGFDRAKAMVTDLDTQPSTSVLSEDVLSINHRGVACFAVSDSRFTRRYMGAPPHRPSQRSLLAGPRRVRHRQCDHNRAGRVAHPSGRDRRVTLPACREGAPTRAADRDTGRHAALLIIEPVRRCGPSWRLACGCRKLGRGLQPGGSRSPAVCELRPRRALERHRHPKRPTVVSSSGSEALPVRLRPRLNGCSRHRNNDGHLGADLH